MKIENGFCFAFLIAGISIFCSCGKGASADDAKETPADPFVPVSVTSIHQGPMTSYIELNAVSSFLQKSYVKASSNGYLQGVTTFLGKYVEKGQLLFTLKTKEAQSIGNSITSLDSTFKFSGLIEIHASDHGYVTQLNHQPGDYVQEGESLATISDMSSFVFLLDLPYELRPFILNRKTVELVLPDGEKLEGLISSTLPAVDPASQTENIILRVRPPHPLPENLIAIVRIVKSQEKSAQSLPKAAVLANETQDAFWVMKMIDSATAVKVFIKKGIEIAGEIAVDSPRFSLQDRFLVSGNYGLADTAKVKIVEQAQP
jgi:multidrug efflux pump subunit AcrA (membrane-fusion protein)